MVAASANCGQDPHWCYTQCGSAVLVMVTACTRLVEQWEPLVQFFKQEDAKTRHDGKSTEKISHKKPSSKPSVVSPSSGEKHGTSVGTAAKGTFDLTKYLFDQQQPAAKKVPAKTPSNNETDETLQPSKTQQIHQFFCSPLTKAYAPFLIHVTKLFDIANIELQNKNHTFMCCIEHLQNRSRISLFMQHLMKGSECVSTGYCDRKHQLDDK